MRFESLVELSAEQALDIHEDPQGHWASVAVVSFWSMPAKVRLRWPHASVVGPLRTPEGVDLFLRNLLYNPQITKVVLAGADLRQVEAELVRVWRFHTVRAEDLQAHIRLLTGSIRLYQADDDGLDALLAEELPARGRRLRLPPPAPVASATASPGDPGDRVAGFTLGDVWPVALDRILTAGLEVPSQYAPTLELLNLVTVVREPAEALTDAELSRVGLTSAEVNTYAREDFLGTVVRDGATYGYGDRMQPQRLPIERLLHKAPDTRAAYLTPWLPEVDSGLEAGRPCLVGVWFRKQQGALTLTVAFRSHDMFKGYLLNMAAACQWVVDEAARLSLTPGSVTCVSYSAHLYANTWEAAREVVDTARKPPVRWDLRSRWAITREVERMALPKIGDRAWAAHGQSPMKVQHEVVALDDLERFCVGTRPAAYLDHEGREQPMTEAVLKWLGCRDAVDWWDVRQWAEAIGWQPKVSYRATARDPKTNEIIAVFEAPNGDQLRKLVGESGLIQEVSNALWVGSEIARVEAP